MVEDHEPTRTTLARILSRRGHLVLEAATVSEALSHAATADFDVLISDIGLPDGDGYGLMRQLRQQRPDLAGIAVSGYGSDEDLILSAQAGFATHLIKPVDIHALERSLRELVQS
jgi:CheY-like chemotaxis protein